MSTPPPDEAPGRRPDPNPYEPPADHGRVRQAVAKGMSTGAVGCLSFLASLVAFVATCVPVGFGVAIQNNRASEYFLLVGSVLGLIVAVAVGIGVARALGGKPR